MGAITTRVAVHAVPNRSEGAQTRAEYLLAAVAVRLLGILPRDLSRHCGSGIAAVAWHLMSRLRTVGMRNLQIAFPAWTDLERRLVLRSTYRNLGLLLAEFCKMPGYTREAASKFIRYEGLENYLRARDRGKGVLVLTGHLGAWELSSFYHSLMGWPMGMVIRRLDNPLVDNMVNAIRCLHGNRVIHKDDFARGIIEEMRSGQTVGILMDTNMTPPQGVFVPFFGVEACTASGLSRIARKTGAAVLPGFLLWEPSESRYVLHFGEELEVDSTDDPETDAVTNTARFTRSIESYIRRYPDQWLWMHRRWKTRPPGEEAIY